MAMNISPGKGIDDFNTIIEIAANSGEVKYEYDKELGLLTVDRFMPTSMRYPCNYGFVPNTLAEDEDPVDVLVVTPDPVQPGTLMRVRAIGILNMADEKGEDSKILAVPVVKACVAYQSIASLQDLSSTLLDAIVHFFEHYKDLEANKWVKVTGWGDKAAAERELQASIKRFQDQPTST